MVDLNKWSPIESSYLGDQGSIPGLERSPGEENGNPVQYSCLENFMDRGAWGGYSPWGHKESDMTEHIISTHNMDDAQKHYVKLKKKTCKDFIQNFCICFFICYAYCTYGIMYLYRHIYIYMHVSW